MVAHGLKINAVEGKYWNGGTWKAYIPTCNLDGIFPHFVLNILDGIHAYGETPDEAITNLKIQYKEIKNFFEHSNISI